MVCMSSTATHTDQDFMRLALKQASLAARLDEVPIGAVVVVDNEIIASAYNRRETDCDPTSHAELLAIRQASQILRRWRLTGATVYATLEPCPMCAGLMHQARIDRCVYGASDPKAGALGTLYDLHKDSRLNHQFTVTGGVLADESAALLKEFFARKRITQHRCSEGK